jgi:hypothetical protein
VTVLETPSAVPGVVDEAQLLIQEAKQHRRHRRLLTGAVSFMVVVALVVATVILSTGSGGKGPSTAPASPAPIATAAASAASLSFRPVLCYAAPFAVVAGAAASTGPLPTCSPSSSLTAANLGVAPAAANANGYLGPSNVPVDNQFAAYPSTSSSNDRGNQTVLLGVTGGSDGAGRYLLGPAGLTASGVKSATATLAHWQWVVNLVLTSRGSARWDALAQAQFHALIAVVINGKVVSAPLTQPGQTSFTSFAGRVQISGGFTRAQAKAVAARL